MLNRSLKGKREKKEKPAFVCAEQRQVISSFCFWHFLRISGDKITHCAAIHYLSFWYLNVQVTTFVLWSHLCNCWRDKSKQALSSAPSHHIYKLAVLREPHILLFLMCSICIAGHIKKQVGTQNISHSLVFLKMWYRRSILIQILVIVFTTRIRNL